MSPVRENPGGKAEAPSRLSRNVAIASGGVIALLVVYLTVAAWGERSPVVITFEVVSSESWTDGASTYVPVEVWNTGGQTAAAIEVETSFEIEGSDPLVRRTQIAFLAGGEGARIYAVGPAGAALSVRMIGFQEP